MEVRARRSNAIKRTTEVARKKMKREWRQIEGKIAEVPIDSSKEMRQRKLLVRRGIRIGVSRYSAASAETLSSRISKSRGGVSASFLKVTLYSPSSLNPIFLSSQTKKFCNYM